jgi:hypothetical protein
MTNQTMIATYGSETSIKRPAVIQSPSVVNGRTSVFQTNTQVWIPRARSTCSRFGCLPATTPALAPNPMRSRGVENAPRPSSKSLLMHPMLMVPLIVVNAFSIVSQNLSITRPELIIVG